MRYLDNVKAMNATLSQAFAQGNHPTSIAFPKAVTLTTTLKCNYRCRMCYQQSFKGEVDWEVVEKLRDILPFAQTLQIFGGEPLLYPRIQELFALAHEHRAAITAISNGSLLTEAMCHSIVDNGVFHIKFSLDAGTPGTYKAIRGGNFFKVLGGIARISQLKAQRGLHLPDMQGNFLAMRSNVAELPKLVVIAAEIGLTRINVFYPNILTEDMVDECVYFHQDHCDEHLMKAQETAQRHGISIELPTLFKDSTPVLDYATKRKCFDPWDTLIVDVDGTVSICCGGYPKVGNLKEQDFQDIWNSEAVQRIRRVINTPDEPACCKNCRIRHTTPKDIGLHIGGARLQEYALARYGLKKAG